MNLPFKVRLLNVFRNFFRIGAFERILASLTSNKSPDSFFAKFVPNAYQYPPNSQRAIDRHGIKMNVDVSDYVGHYLYFGFADESVGKLSALCKPGANVIDIGANIGWTVLNLAKRSQTGMVLGFEPDPFNYQCCVKNVSLNDYKNIQLFQVGLSDVQAKLNMEVRVPSNRGQNRIVASGAGYEVDVVRLDDFEPAKKFKHIDVIKVDVEGYEMNILKGAVGILKQHHPVLFIELDDSNLRDQGFSARELISFLNDAGYHDIRAASDDSVINASDDFANRHFDFIAR